MFEEMKKEDFINDATVFIAYLGSLFLSKEFSGIIGVVGSVMAIIYACYRIYKLHIDIQESKYRRDITKIKLQKERKNLHTEENGKETE